LQKYCNICKKNVTFAENIFFLFNVKNMMNLQSQIVSKIKRLRHAKGLSQPQMAELLNMEKSVYARLETGKTY
jgi:DNA-binding XRE family transcriptional regulator